MRLPRRTFLQLAAGASALPVVPRIARAQGYPSRPVRIIVGFAPGEAQPRLLAVPSRAAQRLPHMTAHDMGEVDREIRDALMELGNETE